MRWCNLKQRQKIGRRRLFKFYRYQYANLQSYHTIRARFFVSLTTVRDEQQITEKRCRGQKFHGDSHFHFSVFVRVFRPIYINAVFAMRTANYKCVCLF